jgi:hypothetical protein
VCAVKNEDREVFHATAFYSKLHLTTRNVANIYKILSQFSTHFRNLANAKFGHHSRWQTTI